MTSNSKMYKNDSTIEKNQTILESDDFSDSSACGTKKKKGRKIRL